MHTPFTYRTILEDAYPSPALAQRLLAANPQLSTHAVDLITRLMHKTPSMRPTWRYVVIVSSMHSKQRHFIFSA